MPLDIAQPPNLSVAPAAPAPSLSDTKQTFFAELVRGTSMGHLMQTLVHWGSRNNISDIALEHLFQQLRVVIPRLPTFPQSLRLVQEKSRVKSKEYPVCTKECSMMREPLGEVDENNPIRCPVCRSPFKKAKLKVSLPNIDRLL